MNIRGLTKFTLVDYPGKLACILFTGGCNLLCPYCHNPFLVVDPESQPLIQENDFFKFLESRKNKLDAVVISGGEPTLQNDILEFALKIKAMGFLVKLDTNGTNFHIVKKMIDKNCIDYIGIDYKTPLDKYSIVSGNNNINTDNIKNTIKLTVKNNIPYEIRTTVHKSILAKNDLFRIREELNQLGIKSWSLQQFNNVEILDESISKYPTYSDAELLELSKKINNTKVKGIKLLNLS